MILDLHFSEGEGQGFTGAQLRREASTYGLCSPGRVTALLAALRFANFLAPAPGRNRRERRLVPTPTFLDLHRERWRGMFSAIAHVAPEASARAATLSDAALFGPGIHAIMTSFRQGVRVFEVTPELRPFAERDAGFAILAALLAAEAGEPLSITRLATQFSVSRSHVMDILRLAEAAGFARAVGARGGYAQGPELAGAMARFYLVIFLIFLGSLEACLTSPTD